MWKFGGVPVLPADAGLAYRWMGMFVVYGVLMEVEVPHFGHRCTVIFCKVCVVCQHMCVGSDLAQIGNHTESQSWNTMPVVD